MRILPGIVLVVIVCWSCQNKSEESIMVFKGDWNATWELNDSTLIDYYTPEQLKMNGTISFMEENKVEITAYGFRGCVFSSDTATNELYYHFLDSLLNMVNADNEVIFSYMIDELSSDKISLNLLSDIHLRMIKK